MPRSISFVLKATPTAMTTTTTTMTTKTTSTMQLGDDTCYGHAISQQGVWFKGPFTRWCQLIWIIHYGENRLSAVQAPTTTKKSARELATTIRTKDINGQRSEFDRFDLLNLLAKLVWAFVMLTRKRLPLQVAAPYVHCDSNLTTWTNPFHLHRKCKLFVGDRQRAEKS